VIETPQEIADRFGIRSIETLDPPQLDAELLEQIPYPFSKERLLLPIEDCGDRVVVAVADPLDLDSIDELRMRLGREIEICVCPADALSEAIDATYQQMGQSASDLLADLGEGGQLKGDEIASYDLLDDHGQAPIVKLLNRILAEGIKQGASDIHFEPLENDLRVRYRIDGVLQTRHTPSREYQGQLITRLKVISGLDIAEHRLPQDGRIRLRMGDRSIDFRVSTVPIANGERIVLRILDKGNIVLGLDRLGMDEASIALFRDFISLPEGIVLVTGPTGSGKTTTLYSAITDLSTDRVNIMTVEDPVEYKLPGIAQIAIRSKIGLTFAAGLRHILRQDPDIIMVGEIRDQETAEIAIQASLTGHLVFSTLHTNDAPSALTRLADMGIESYLLSSAVVGVVAQRLVRQLCPHCKQEAEADESEQKHLGEAATHYRAVGCPACFDTGYAGRCAIYEVMRVDAAIKQQIVQSADAVELRRIASERGMQGLFEQGKALVLEGKTSLAELLRVTRGSEQ